MKGTMEGTPLEIAIGLALVFFITASLVSAVNEIVSRSLNIRSKALWARLDELLQANDHRLGVPFIWNSLSKADVRPKHLDKPLADSGKDLLTGLANTGSVHGLDYVSGKDGKKTTKVSEIPNEVFAAAALELVHTYGTGSNLTERVASLTRPAAGDSDAIKSLKESPFGLYLRANTEQLTMGADQFVAGIGQWFDGQMRVLTRTYRRNLKYVLAALGLVVAIVFNVNAITIGTQLAKDAQFRQSVVLFADELTADEFTGCNQDDPSESLTCATDQIGLFEGAGIIIPIQGTYFDDQVAIWFTSAKDNPVNLFRNIAGILITVIAVSFGGPFWFDFLRSLTGMRRKTS